jgi:hypothetical protein
MEMPSPEVLAPGTKLRTTRVPRKTKGNENNTMSTRLSAAPKEVVRDDQTDLTNKPYDTYRITVG